MASKGTGGGGGGTSYTDEGIDDYAIYLNSEGGAQTESTWGEYMANVRNNTQQQERVNNLRNELYFLEQDLQRQQNTNQWTVGQQQDTQWVAEHPLITTEYNNSVYNETKSLLNEARSKLDSLQEKLDGSFEVENINDTPELKEYLDLTSRARSIIHPQYNL